MKSRRKVISILITLAIVVNIAVLKPITVFAHEAPLEVNYDACVEDLEGDGIDEMWYILENDGGCRHISHQETTIKYFFEDDPDRGECWTVGGISASEAELIKAAFNFRR